jgi:hypothetical protein
MYFFDFVTIIIEAASLRGLSATSGAQLSKKRMRTSPLVAEC